MDGRALADFLALQDFGLDPFQISACETLAAGRSVLVAAPTGAGKTVVGEFAVHLARRSGKRSFYTTPIKALSNQKYADLVGRYGPDDVGLLTGDNAINGDAPIVVMTTEVLRNMIYENADALRTLSHVVMDEVHYLANFERGAVWEEVLINLPQGVAIAALSATVSNAEEFGHWLASVRGRTDVIVEEHRPVPLWQHVLVGSHLHDLFVDDAQRTINPELLDRARDQRREARSGGYGRRGGGRGHGGRGGRGGGGRGGPGRVSRPALVRRLGKAGLLPAIDFIFSRAGCDAAVQQCMSAGICLTDEKEQAQIAAVAIEASAKIDSDDLAALGFSDWLYALERGVAAHHAGMVPIFKEVVERLFQRGLIRCVFATETLALGINMPARSVVLERLVKWNGDSHVDLTPGEYTQLTGRAGRRGIDVEGHAVVAWSEQLNPRSLAGLASTRTYPLNSSFRPSYNMAVNLVSTVGKSAAEDLLRKSFAQFQAQASVAEIQEEHDSNAAALAGYAEAMTCDQGDFIEYARLRERLSRMEKDEARIRRGRRREEILTSMAELSPGDVIVIRKGRRTGTFAVVAAAAAADVQVEPNVIVVSRDGKVRRLIPGDVQHPLVPAGRVVLPAHFSTRSAVKRDQLAERLRGRDWQDEGDGSSDVEPQRRGQSTRGSGAKAKDEVAPTKDEVALEIEALRGQLRDHPCHDCDDREAHARWAERHAQLSKRQVKIEKRITTATTGLVKQFDRICGLLIDLGYLQKTGEELSVSRDGALLTRVYGETDLLTAESIRQGHWHKLKPAELASVCAALVYESRGRDDGGTPRLPKGPAGQALTRLGQDWERLKDLEREHQLDTLPELDFGLCWGVLRWASGVGLDQVLWEADLTAGDFVRWCKQIIDLLGQIAAAVPDSKLAWVAKDAAGLIDRGVVTYAGLEA